MQFLTPMLLFQAALTALVNASFALLVGTLVAQRWQAQSGGGCGNEVSGMLHDAMRSGFVVGAGATLLSLWQVSATIADVSLLESGPGLWVLFVRTSYGVLGVASFLTLGVGGVLSFALRRHSQDTAYQALISGLLLAFAVCRVAMGHAAEDGLLSVSATIELVHLLATASWAGSVAAAAWVVLPGIAGTAPAARIEGYLFALSRWATGALAAVLATGVYNAYRVLNTPAELIQSDYGWVLTTKLCFVGIAVALGAWNRFIGFPAALAGETMVETKKNTLQSITRVLRFESIALLIVLLAAAVLTASAPPTAG
jgi:putative copper resistance protein D